MIINTPYSPSTVAIWVLDYEHIIRNETELDKIREYIRFNPLKWDEDEENPNKE